MELVQTPFKVVTISATELPQQLAYLALHTDYSADHITGTDLTEDACGEVVIKRLLAGGRGHFGPLEHATITLSVRCDHPTMMQFARHRLLSFDVQSLRYTGDQFIDVAEGRKDVEEVFYIRPEGIYESRDKKGYAWSVHDRIAAKERILDACKFYNEQLTRGVAPEHARHLVPSCYLQNALVTGNLRAWLHVFDMRTKINAQVEIQTLAELMLLEIQKWSPDIIGWYRTHRERKALLAP